MPGSEFAIQERKMTGTPLGIVEFHSYVESLPALLELLEVGQHLSSVERVVIKPNLVNTSRPPVTTPVELVAAIVDYVRNVSSARIVVAEGCGSPLYDTYRPYRKLGYVELADSRGIGLVDLNNAELLKLGDSRCRLYPQFMMPRVVMESFLISVPVLKRHSLAKVTLTMKNMMGCAPPEHYGGLVWKKSKFHKKLHRSIFEMNLYRTPDLTILDGSVGLARFHLGGPKCKPPVRKLVGGFDPVAVDSYGAGLLCLDWRTIKHIALAHGVLGDAEAGPVSISEAVNL
jgi:uncharacterized protein (DUF362 family)